MFYRQNSNLISTEWILAQKGNLYVQKDGKTGKFLPVIKHIPLSILCSSRYPLNQFHEDEHEHQGHHDSTWRTDWDGTLDWLADTYADAGPKSIKESGACGPSSPSGVIHGAQWRQTDGELQDYLYFKEGELMVSVLTLKAIYL